MQTGDWITVEGHSWLVIGRGISGWRLQRWDGEHLHERNAA